MDQNKAITELVAPLFKEKSYEVLYVVGTDVFSGRHQAAAHANSVKAESVVIATSNAGKSISLQYIDLKSFLQGKNSSAVVAEATNLDAHWQDGNGISKEAVVVLAKEEQLAAKVANLEEAIKTNSEASNKLKQANAEMEQQVANVTKALEGADQMVAHLKSKLEVAETTIADLTSNLFDAKKSIAHIATEIEAGLIMKDNKALRSHFTALGDSLITTNTTAGSEGEKQPE